MLTYYITPKFEPYVRTHGNSKSNLAKYDWKEGAHAGAKEILSSVSHNVSGVMGATAPGEQPRDEMQVSDAAAIAVYREGGMSDELLIVMQKAKAENPFIRVVETTPDPAIVVCTDSQLVRFCAPSPEFPCSILTVDPNFCLGDFECTP